MDDASGISLIALIITIIVIIILAAIVIFNGLNAPDRANFAKFTQDVDNVQMAVNNKYADLKVRHAVAKEYRTDEQLYIEIATAVDPGQYASMNTVTVKDNTSAGIVEGGSNIQNIIANRTNMTEGEQITEGGETKAITGALGMILPKVRENNTSWYITKEGRVFNANGYAYQDRTYFDAKTYAEGELGSNSTKNANRAEKIYETALSQGMILASNVPEIGIEAPIRTLYLYNNGIIGEEAGDFVRSKRQSSYNTGNFAKKSEGYLAFDRENSSQQWADGGFYTENKIDLTNYSTLTFEFTSSSYITSSNSSTYPQKSSVSLGYTSITPSTNMSSANVDRTLNAYQLIATEGETNSRLNLETSYDVDISEVKGSYYVGLFTTNGYWAGQSWHLYVTRIYLH